VVSFKKGLSEKEFHDSALVNKTTRSACIEERQAMHDIEGLIRSQAGDRDEEWYSYERVFFTMRLWGSLGRVL
jgi:hypothetical protein